MIECPKNILTCWISVIWFYFWLGVPSCFNCSGKQWYLINAVLKPRNYWEFTIDHRWTTHLYCLRNLSIRWLHNLSRDDRFKTSSIRKSFDAYVCRYYLVFRSIQPKLFSENESIIWTKIHDQPAKVVVLKICWRANFCGEKLLK